MNVTSSRVEGPVDFHDTIAILSESCLEMVDFSIVSFSVTYGRSNQTSVESTAVFVKGGDVNWHAGVDLYV